MKPGCPNISCKYYHQSNLVIKDGFYFRKDDARKIHRFRCLGCRKRFSASTQTLEYKHKKRRVNRPLYNLLSSGISMRRAALILKIHRTTVERKLEYLAKKATLSQQELLENLKNNPVKFMQFDDLITIEHTKLKPLSVSIAVDKKRRFILGLKVSQIPAFGHLSRISLKKYGKRKSTHLEKLHELFKEIKPCLTPDLLVESDEHQSYGEVVKSHLPSAIHQTYKSSRACIAGQGELKKLTYDPLFKINHTCAMMRANVNRIFRKTWCTTKNPKRLEQHLIIFASFYNQILLKDQFQKI